MKAIKVLLCSLTVFVMLISGLVPEVASEEIVWTDVQDFTTIPDSVAAPTVGFNFAHTGSDATVSLVKGVGKKPITDNSLKFAKVNEGGTTAAGYMDYNLNDTKVDGNNEWLHFTTNVVNDDSNATKYISLRYSYSENDNNRSNEVDKIVEFRRTDPTSIYVSVQARSGPEVKKVAYPPFTMIRVDYISNLLTGRRLVYINGMLITDHTRVELPPGKDGKTNEVAKLRFIRYDIDAGAAGRTHLIVDDAKFKTFPSSTTLETIQSRVLPEPKSPMVVNFDSFINNTRVDRYAETTLKKPGDVIFTDFLREPGSAGKAPNESVFHIQAIPGSYEPSTPLDFDGITLYPSVASKPTSSTDPLHSMYDYIEPGDVVKVAFQFKPDANFYRLAAPIRLQTNDDDQGITGTTGRVVLNIESDSVGIATNTYSLPNGEKFRTDKWYLVEVVMTIGELKVTADIYLDGKMLDVSPIETVVDPTKQTIDRIHNTQIMHNIKCPPVGATVDIPEERGISLGSIVYGVATPEDEFEFSEIEIYPKFNDSISIKQLGTGVYGVPQGTTVGELKDNIEDATIYDEIQVVSAYGAPLEDTDTTDGQYLKLISDKREIFAILEEYKPDKYPFRLSGSALMDETEWEDFEAGKLEATATSDEDILESAMLFIAHYEGDRLEGVGLGHGTLDEPGSGSSVTVSYDLDEKTADTQIKILMWDGTNLSSYLEGAITLPYTAD